MRKIKVLIVDDAIVVRRLLTKLVADDPMLEVVAAAANGRIALDKIPLVSPDVVVLDVEMPEMNGLETLAAIRKTHPRLPVIMFSSLTDRGAAVTLDALALGADDYVAKPAEVGNMTEALERVRAELIPKIKTFCCRPTKPNPVAAKMPPTPVAPVLPLVGAASLTQRVDVVAIGVSTGGPNVLAELLPQLPADFPVPIVIVQHMPPIFTRHLAARLASESLLQVGEGADGTALAAGQVWLAPGGFHMSLEPRGTAVQLKIYQGLLENSCRPAVDVLFRAVAELYRSHALAVVLTGMGNDGLRGCERIRAAGGRVLVQDEASSVVWGMPGSVAKAGLADKVLPLDQLAAEIIGRVRLGRAGVRPVTPASRQLRAER